MKGHTDLGFTFHRNGNDFIILHHGKKATTLRGNRADDFKQDIAEMSISEQQQLMARLTGNYKRDNERGAKNHPRNKR